VKDSTMLSLKIYLTDEQGERISFYFLAFNFLNKLFSNIFAIDKKIQIKLKNTIKKREKDKSPDSISKKWVLNIDCFKLM
jgi:hypothetical protein